MLVDITLQAEASSLGRGRDTLVRSVGVGSSSLSPRLPHVDGSVLSIFPARGSGKDCGHALPIRLQVGQGGAAVALRVQFPPCYIPSRRKTGTRDFVSWRGGTSSMAFLSAIISKLRMSGS